MKSFGSKELENCVKKLGFTFKNIQASHVKYLPSPRNHVSSEARPYFVFQLGKKTYDKNGANRYITQLKRLGFSKEEIEKNLN